MKKLILIIGMMLLGAPLSFAQNGHDLFQKALQKERAEGNLEAAIALYERIVEEHASRRPRQRRRQRHVRGRTVADRRQYRGERQRRLVRIRYGAGRDLHH